MVCRVCLNYSEIELQIFDEKGVKQRIPQILQLHLWFTPSPDDPISQAICLRCWFKLLEFHQFYEAAKEAHKFYQNATTLSRPVEIVVKHEDANHEIWIDEREDIDTQRNKNDNTEIVNPLHESEVLETITIKTESPEANKLDEYVANGKGIGKRAKTVADNFQIDSADDDDDGENSDGNRDFDVVTDSHSENEPEKTMQTIEVKTTRNSKKTTTANATKTAKRGRSSVDILSEENEYLQSATQTKEVGKNKCKDDKTSQPIDEDNEIVLNEMLKSSKRTSKKSVGKQENIKIKKAKVKQKARCWSNTESEELVRKHLSLNCDICGHPANDFCELKKHFQVTHPNTKAYIKCCNRRFNKKTRVVQHAYKHEDPKFFQCNICEKTFASVYSMRSHRTAYHPTENELIFECDQCEKRFARKHLLDYHKAVHVPMEERKYVCSDCQQTFANKTLLNAHINTKHKRTTNICHVCAKTIWDKQSFEKHVRLHFEESGPRVKCTHPGCDAYLKDEENLKVHLRRHKQANQIISCELCEKVVKSRMALARHKNYAHTSQQFDCNLCSKTFKRKLSFKEHMASHLGEPLYKCPFCARTFNSNANMYSHKKKQHPIEYENWRKAKTESAQTTIK